MASHAAINQLQGRFWSVLALISSICWPWTSSLYLFGMFLFSAISTCFHPFAGIPHIFGDRRIRDRWAKNPWFFTSFSNQSIDQHWLSLFLGSSKITVFFPIKMGTLEVPWGPFPQEEAADPVAQDDVRDLTDSTAAPAPRRPAPAGLARVKTGPQMVRRKVPRWVQRPRPRCVVEVLGGWSFHENCGDLWGPICLAQMENWWWWFFSPTFFEATHILTMDLRVFDQLDTFTNYSWASKWGKTLNLWLSYGSQIRHADIHMFFQADESELALWHLFAASGSHS